MGCDRPLPVSGEHAPDISIHAPRVGCDALGDALGVVRVISIHAPRVGCDVNQRGSSTYTIIISIHAPRVGCDSGAAFTSSFGQTISIHAPRVGCDGEHYYLTVDKDEFQSTHPVWGATIIQIALAGHRGISIHAPRVGCDDLSTHGNVQIPLISIHAPRVGCDHSGEVLKAQTIISIHAPRVGCDLRPEHYWVNFWYFNPRTPCGVRRLTMPNSSPRLVFQSTHPVWGATLPWRVQSAHLHISIHAPRVGCDGQALHILGAIKLFQSTHPVWGATLILIPKAI